MASTGFWRPGEKVAEEESEHFFGDYVAKMLTSKASTTRLLHISDWILTKLCFLHEDLGEGPADPPYEGRQEHHDEALQVKLGWLKCKHKQTTRDQQDHQDQEWILLKKGQKRQQEKIIEAVYAKN